MRARRLRWAALSLAAHAVVIAGLVLAPTKQRPEEAELAPIPVAMIQLPPPPEPPPPEPKPVAKPEPKPEPPAPKRPPPRPRVAARPPRVPPPPEVRTIAAAETPAPPDESAVSDSELAGAATAGSGAGGGGTGSGASCDMIRRLQAALRKDPLVRSAVTEAHRGQAIRIWNGSWVRHGAQEGAGLAAVREAVLWEVGFAPEACRHQQMRGLVVLSLADSPGSARLVLGQGSWRWSDLLRVGGRGGG